MSKPAVVDKTTGQKRAYALDALRGLAILMMVLSSVEPQGLTTHLAKFMVLPSFMYHTQVPPPNFKWAEHLAGVSWVDMVFPFFLFSMGAAIPFAMNRRMEQGTPWYKLAGAALLRGLLLSLFAIYVEHIRTGCVDPLYTSGMLGTPLRVFLIGTFGFLILFAALGRLPSTWKSSTRTIVKAAGWIAAVALMFIVRYDPKVSIAHQPGFSLAKFDIIIMILANVAVYSTIVYILTRKNQLLRIGAMGIVMALHFGAGATGWVRSFESNFPIPYLHSLDFLGSTATAVLSTFNSFFSLTLIDYMFLTLMGSIVGDRIIQWMNTKETAESQTPTWSNARWAGLAILLLSTTVLTIILLKGRYIWELVLSLIPLLMVGNKMVQKPVTSMESLIHDIFKWGVYMLAIGMMFEPFQGGIKKDSATLSYFFVSGGLAILTLIVFTIVIDVFSNKRAVQLLIDNGQNPMIAYTAGGNFIGTILVVTGLDAFLKTNLLSPWVYFFGYSVVFTLLVALSVSFCTRKKIFWRT